MSERSLLYVESPNDEHVCYALFEHYGVPQSFVVSQKNGFGNILATLRLELKKADDDRLERIGVLADADADRDARWRELTRVLRRAGYVDLPPAPSTDGTVITQLDRPTIGIWLMPDNVQSGALEHFIATLVPHDDRLWPHADETLRNLIECRFREQDRLKAHVHTWLAWQAEPGRPMGYAIGRGFLRADVPLAARLVDWIRRLFALDTA